MKKSIIPPLTCRGCMGRDRAMMALAIRVDELESERDEVLATAQNLLRLIGRKFFTKKVTPRVIST